MTEKKIKNINIASWLEEERLLKKESESIRELVRSIAQRYHATQVHPLGKEAIWDLLAICSDCERVIDLAKHLRCVSAQHKADRATMDAIRQTFQRLPLILLRAYPGKCDGKVMRFLLGQASLSDFVNTQELISYCNELLLRLMFSSGDDKVFDPSDGEFFDLAVLHRLNTEGKIVNMEWVEQFLYCLYSLDHRDILQLIQQTPPEQESLTRDLIIELYGLAIDAPAGI